MVKKIDDLTDDELAKIGAPRERLASRARKNTVSMGKKGGSRKRIEVEWRATSGRFFRNWERFRLYKTQEEADEALVVLNRKGKDEGYEYRLKEQPEYTA